MAERISAHGAFARIGAAIVLVLATCNPSGHDYLRWALDDLSDFTPLQAILGLVLLGAAPNGPVSVPYASGLYTPQVSAVFSRPPGFGNP